jgi:hypothetical protein
LVNREAIEEAFDDDDGARSGRHGPMKIEERE